MENYLANFIPLLCCDTLWYALLSWPSCSSISELHCSVARLSGSRSILNWSLTPPFQSTLILFGKIVQSRASRMAAADHAVRCETLILFTKSMFSSSPEYLVWGCLPILTSVKEFIMTPGCASWKWVKGKSAIVGHDKADFRSVYHRTRTWTS